MNIVFMGTPWMAVPILRAIHDRGHKILAVVSQPDRPAGRHQTLQPTPVKALSAELGIPVSQPEKIRTPEFRGWMESLAPEILVVVAYGRILPGWLLAIPTRGCVNVHFSLLPKYRGAAPVNWAIARGERETGVTTMLMDEGMDTGPLLLQRAIPIFPEESTPELSKRLVEIGASLLLESLDGLESGSIVPVAQNHALATMAPILKREDGLIDWELSAAEIDARVRGFQPWPGAWTTWKGSRLIIWSSRIASIDEQAQIPSLTAGPGVVVRAPGRKGFLVACGGGSLLAVEALQLEGKKRLPANDFLNGHDLESGARFGGE